MVQVKVKSLNGTDSEKTKAEQLDKELRELFKEGIK